MDIEELANVSVRVQALIQQIGVQEGILGGHVHNAGEFMIGYRYRYMEMDGNRIGTRRVPVADVFAEGFMVAPTRMTMNMHMVHAMYAPSDEWTWMLMAPLKRLSMDHLRMNGTTFNVTTEGIGDVSLTGFYTFLRSEQKGYADKHPEKGCWRQSWDEYHQAFAGLALYFPTGSVNETNSMGTRLPYPMQLGSGTYDIEPSLTYTAVSENWGWGAHGSALMRLGTNTNQYTLGDRYVLSAWLARQLNDRWSFATRLEGTYWGNIHGSDPALNPMMVPTARTDLRGGNRLDFWVGVSCYIPEGFLEGNRWNVEYGLPLTQALDGPQLETDAQLQASWSWRF